MIISATALSLASLRLLRAGGMYCFVLHYYFTDYCTTMDGTMVRYSVTALQCREDNPHPRKIKLYYIFIYINIYKYIV